MLPAASRLRQRSDFAAAARSGRRAARPRLVVHLLLATTPAPGLSVPPRVGFVVGRSVGGAVVRNRIRRQLRHLMSPRLAALPSGARVVVRVLPAAATSTGAQLAADLDAVLAR